MKKRKIKYLFRSNLSRIIIFVLVLIPLSISAEQLSLREKFEWLKETFEENDAGFQHVIDQKGWDEYQRHNASIESELRNVESLIDALDIYRNWLSFFRSGHLSININWDAIDSKPEHQ